MELNSETLGEPQLKTVLNYFKYINTISEARQHTFEKLWQTSHEYDDYERSVWWNSFVVDSQAAIRDIEHILKGKK